MKVLDALQWRYAVRKFSEEKIPKEQLDPLLEAVCLSPSSYGLQPYRIMVVESKSVQQQLLPFSFGQDWVAENSHLLVFAAHAQIGDATVDRYIEQYAKRTETPSAELSGFSEHVKSALADKTPEQQQEWAHQQAYVALGNLLTCAALMKIDACPITGFDRQAYDQVLGLEGMGLTTTVICPIGRRHPDDTQAERPKVRFDQEDLVLAI